MADSSQEQSEEQREEQKEVGLYEKIASRTAELVDSGRRSLDEALKKASEEIASAGDASRERVEKVRTWVRRDLAAMGEASTQTGQELRNALDPQRVAVGLQSVFASILSSTAETIGDWAGKAEKSLELNTGEVTSIGTLTCKSCEAEMHMKKTARIPPCPKCRKTVFRKSY